MNKKVAVGIGVTACLLIVLAASVVAVDWDDFMNYDEPQSIPYDDVVVGDDINKDSLNYALFEEYGPLMMVLALLMFGAIVGGVCIAREEVECDDSD